MCIDEEDEMISVSSDDELMDALTARVSDGQLRLYVKLCTPPRHSVPAAHQLMAGLNTACGQSGATPGEPENECEQASCTGQSNDIRQLIIDSVNSYLQPVGQFDVKQYTLLSLSRVYID